jgi:cytochrome c-type biogenesis protein CcsB
MSSAIGPKEIIEVSELEPRLSGKVRGILPVLLPVLFAGVLIFSRVRFGASNFLYEGTLTMLALICYITASAIAVTNLFTKDNTLRNLSLITIGLGYSFNFSGWMIRWIEAGEAEGWKEGINGIWRYYPLDTLYALTLGFCCGASLATLFVIRKPKNEFLAGFSMPLISIILAIAIMFGNEIRTLMPILDSYWRPIHVSIATIAYGVCLVSFGIALAYLFKDGVRSEAFAISVLLYGILIYVTIGVTSNGYSYPTVLTQGEYGTQLSFLNSPLPLRGNFPGIGPIMVGIFFAIILSLVLFIIDWSKPNRKVNQLSWILFRLSAILQVLVIGLVFYQIKQSVNLIDRIPTRDYEYFGAWLRDRIAGEAGTFQNSELARMWLSENKNSLSYSLNSNPVEIGALISLFVCLLLISVFAWKREQVVNSIPRIDTLDSLLYKTVSIAFPLLCMLLITGAVWANESWGRYWGWDPKETGALVATMAYAGFLHTRLAHGWRGRKSAYFALLGFALIVFTWLGVSFLLSGLHSYAQV